MQNIQQRGVAPAIRLVVQVRHVHVERAQCTLQMRSHYMRMFRSEFTGGMRKVLCLGPFQKAL